MTRAQLLRTETRSHRENDRTLLAQPASSLAEKRALEDRCAVRTSMSDARHGLAKCPALSFREWRNVTRECFSPTIPRRRRSSVTVPGKPKLRGAQSISIVRLCVRCAEIWDEQERHVIATGEAPVVASASCGAKVGLEVSSVTRMREAGHRALYPSDCIREGNEPRSSRCATSGSRQQENARC